MIRKFGSAIPGQRCHQSLRQILNLSDQGTDNALAVLAADLDQHHEARGALYQRCDMAVFGTAQKVPFPLL